MMPNIGVTDEEMINLIGQNLYDVWFKLSNIIDEKYEADHLFNHLGKNWVYEYKYRIGGKTLCALYAKKDCIGFMVILGKCEREVFETKRETFSKEFIKVYDDSKTYHDGKWMMFELANTTMFNDFMNVLMIKRKPNKKNAS